MSSKDRVGNRDQTAAALFAAARAYRTPARTRRRALRALGLPVGISLLASNVARAAAAIPASVKVWVVLAAAVLAASVIGGAVYLSAPPTAPREEAPMPTPMRTPESLRMPTPVLVRTPAPAPTGRIAPSLVARKPTARLGVSSTALPMPLTASSLGSAPPLRASSLEAELMLIGEARARLRAGDPRGALAVLDGHARRFPTGALAEEVDLLSIRALFAAGDPLRARSLGARFLAQRPTSPLTGAVRALLDDSPTSPRQKGDEP